MNNNKQYRINPPYAKQLTDAVRQGKKPPNDIFVFIGKDAWNFAKRKLSYLWVTLLPIDTPPDKYRWDFVNGFSVLVIDTSGETYTTIRQLAYELLCAGATVVRLLTFHNQVIIFSRR